MPPKRPSRASSAMAAQASSNVQARGRGSISRFTRVTKPSLSATSRRDEKVPGSSSLSEKVVEPTTDPSSLRRQKGKQSGVDQPPTPTSSAKRQKLCHPQAIETPKKPFYNPQCLPTPDRTPSHTIYNTAANLTTPTKQTATPNSSYASPPVSPASLRVDNNEPESSSEDLPDELYDLVDLHAAFLKSLSLHFAHYGTASPVDTRSLRPSVSKTWGRRSVTLQDIRRILGILQWSSSSPQGVSLPPRDSKHLDERSDLQLYDYGNGSICVDKSTSAIGFARPINEELLNDVFESNLRTLWANFQSSRKTLHFCEDNATTIFITGLPEAVPALHPSAKSSIATARKALGQARLADVTGLTQKKYHSTASATSATAKQSASNVSNNQSTTPLKSRKSALLARLNAKSTAAAQSKVDLNATDAKERAKRRAALQRTPEIVSILSFLGGGTSVSSSAALANQTSTGTRQTHSLPALVQTIQASTKGGALGADEARLCLEILAEEGDALAGAGFVRIVTIGGRVGEGTVVGVVVDVGKRAGLRVVRERVERLLASA